MRFAPTFAALALLATPALAQQSGGMQGMNHGQMAGMNQQLDDDIETVFLMADVSLQPIASRLVKEIALYGGPIHKFVSPAVREEVEARVAALGLKGQG